MNPPAINMKRIAIELYRKIDTHAISVLGSKLENDITKWGMINEHTKQIYINIEIAQRKYLKLGLAFKHLQTSTIFIMVNTNIIAKAE